MGAERWVVNRERTVAAVDEPASVRPHLPAIRTAVTDRQFHRGWTLTCHYPRNYARDADQDRERHEEVGKPAVQGVFAYVSTI